LRTQVQRQAKAIVCEHQSAVRCVAVSADLDTVVSGSSGQLLLHTTAGELVCSPAFQYMAYGSPARLVPVSPNPILTAWPEQVRAIDHPTCKEVRVVKTTTSGRIIAYYADGDGTLAVFTINGMSFGDGSSPG
jgi:hypothetical protein